MSVRIVVADDQSLVRTGFRLILTSQPDFEVVGEASDGGEAVRLVAQLSPDVVLMDIRMPGVDGLAAARQILSADATPTPKVVMLTTFDLDEYVYEALHAGASGFLLKDGSPEELIAAVRRVMAGESMIAPQVTARLIAAFVRRPPARAAALPDPLTGREEEVLRFMARGLSNTEIAAALVVSEATIKTHVSRILAKLNARDRVQAVVWAFEHNYAS